MSDRKMSQHTSQEMLALPHRDVMRLVDAIAAGTASPGESAFFCEWARDAARAIGTIRNCLTASETESWTARDRVAGIRWAMDLGPDE